MTSTSDNTNVEIKTFPIRLEKAGQITIPQSVQAHLSVITGDMLTLLQIGDLVLLTPKQLQVPQLADAITTLMEDASLNLSDLLEGLEMEREIIWQEQQQNA
jgi:bifunctional DNA-binding transcriptional regulator/antitoxin component of YhaV-PrlF toxin-antitoxin module